MLGCRPTCEGPGAFSSSVSLPLGRRHELANNPAVAEAGARTFSNSLCAFTAFRKRPGCLTETSNLTSRHEQPLDLSLPKLKVRHHWSGGSIVQINDTTAQTAAPLSQCRCCCTSNNCCSCSSSSKRIPTRPLTIETATTVQPSLEWYPTVHSSNTGDWIAEHPHRPESSISRSRSGLAETLTSPVDHCTTPVSKASRHRLVAATTTTTAATAADCNPHLHVQVRIPIFPQFIEIDSRPLTTEDAIRSLIPFNVVTNENDPLDKLKIFLLKNNNNRKLTSAGVWAHPQVEHVMEDDLRRLTDSFHQLQMSGYYYGSLSWQESLQLLQGTQVGTFLIRDSSDSRYLYALSVQTDRGPTSVRIHYVNGSFQLDADPRLVKLPAFQSVVQLIDFYVSEWKQCQEKRQVWLDNSGHVYSSVVLRKPLLKECPSLQHLCRLSWNRLPNGKKLHWERQGTIPHTVQAYLREYPFQH